MPFSPKPKQRPFHFKKETTSASWTNIDDPFYDSSAWRSTRKTVLTEEPICIFCKTQIHIAASVVCDHIIPKRLGGAHLDRNNLQGICSSCHNTKSAIEGKFDDVIKLKAYALSEGVGVKNFWRFL